MLDGLSTGSLNNITLSLDRVDIVKADIRDPQAAEGALEGIETVVHEVAIISVHVH